MDRIKKLKSPKIYISFAIAAIISAFLFPNEGRFKYSYQKGRSWSYETLISPVDFAILKTEADLLLEKEQKSQEIISYYNYDKSVINRNLGDLSALGLERNLDLNILRSLIDNFTSMYNRGVLSSYEELESNKMIIVQRDKRASEIPSTEIYDIETAQQYLSSSLSFDFPKHNTDSIINALALYDYVVPNLIYDQKKTTLMQKETISNISPTRGMIYAGQLIVSEGEIVTAEIAQLLDSYKSEYEISFGYSGSYAGLIVGHSILIIVVLVLLFAVIYFIDIKIFTNPNNYYFILSMFLLIFVSTVIIKNIDTSFLYMVPYAVFAIYIVSFFKQSFAFPVYSVILLPLLLFTRNGLELYVINLFAGAVAIVSFFYLNRGWFQFINSFFIFLATTITYLSFKLILDGSLLGVDTRIFLYLALNALFVVGAYPLVFLFEKLFALLSNSRLRDLADTNTKLLLDLAQKAPGTFQHSLQVSTMADAAAREVGGDVLLIRVGALYHDIGKVMNPQCFVENQAPGFDYHKDLSPIESAQEIIRHVDDGMELARKHKLPATVSAFISTHHAQSLTGYFYAKYCNEGGDPENQEPFKYHGELPTTKEQVIVLMADAVEAATRTLKDYTEESISNLIKSIIDRRLSDSQLANADISIRDITIIKEAFKKHMMQVYHGRIVYPDVKK